MNKRVPVRGKAVVLVFAAFFVLFFLTFPTQRGSRRLHRSKVAALHGYWSIWILCLSRRFRKWAVHASDRKSSERNYLYGFFTQLRIERLHGKGHQAGNDSQWDVL